MNLFYLHKDPVECAKMHCDKHTVKMILELAQMLSTAHRFLDGKEYIDQGKNGRKIKRWFLDGDIENILYKATHLNHPSAKWVRETSENYIFTYALFLALCEEYTFRYKKTHLTQIKLQDALSILPKNIVIGSMTEVPQAMPEYCRRPCSIDAYRNYYITEKSSILQYTNRDVPEFISKG